LTEVSLARSCVPADRDDAGLLDRGPPPEARLADVARVDRGEPRLAEPFTRAPADLAADAGLEGVRLDTFDALALRGVV